MSRKRQTVASVVDLVACAQTATRLREVAARGPKTEAKQWYRVSALDGSTTEIMIYDEIGEWGITAADFVAELRGVHTPNITVRVNSGGGSIFDGFAIYNALLNHNARVVARVEGVAASAASFIVQAADEIVAAEASTMMVHGGSGMCYGKAADMREMAGLLDKLDGQMAAIYAQRTERPAAEWLAQMNVDTWYTADEAKAAGLVDRVETAGEGTTGETAAAGVVPVASSEPLDFAGLTEALKGVFA